MRDVHKQFNLVGGTAAQVTVLETSADPFVFQSWFNDPTPTLHLGFTSSATANPGGTFWNLDAACRILEAHPVQDLTAFGWTFNYPEARGELYYDVTLSNGAGDRYFRISYVMNCCMPSVLAHSNDSDSI